LGIIDSSIYQNILGLISNKLVPLLSSDVGVDSLKTLKLKSLPETSMRCLWKGLVLSNLTTLVVSKCKRLTHVFSDSMIASLVQLNFLNIESCEELEQIIARDNDDGKD